MADLQSEAVLFARFLHDTVDAYTRKQFTIESQTREGFALFLHEVSQRRGVSVISTSEALSDGAKVLEVAKPGPKPNPPNSWYESQTPEADRIEYARKIDEWQNHVNLYEQLFSARSINETMELVFCSLLLATAKEGQEFRRHALKFDCEVKLLETDGRLQVLIRNAPTLEVNWLPGAVRSTFLSRPEDVDEYEEIESLNEVERKVGSLCSIFGTSSIQLKSPRERVDDGEIGLGGFPAVLLRRRDSSLTLQLIAQIVEEFESGTDPSEPFKMIVSPDYTPTKMDANYEVAVLPLEANDEQRETILSTLTDRHVVIQGPPGTGKTHTIANLASLLMAEGRRVLITAENDHALTEVQGKLPENMQALLLPFFRDSGSAPLEKSVNLLLQNASSRSFKVKLQNDLITSEARLSELTQEREQLEAKLGEVSALDQEFRLIEGQELTLAGHLKLVRARDRELQLVDEFLSKHGRAQTEIQSRLPNLFGEVKDEHVELATYRFPEGVASADEFSDELSTFRSELNHLREPGDVDYSSLQSRRDEFLALSQELHKYPQINWRDLPFSEDEYAAYARAAKDASERLNPSVGLYNATGEEVLPVLEAFCQLSGPLADFDLPQLKQLIVKTKNLPSSSIPISEVFESTPFIHLLPKLQDAISLLETDSTGLLEKLVEERLNDSTAVLAPVVKALSDLRQKIIEPIGLPVEVGANAPTNSELLEKAEELLGQLAAGASFKSIFGRSRIAKKAQSLLDSVTVGGSQIDTLEEVERVVGVLRCRVQLEVAINTLQSYLPRPFVKSEVPEILSRIEALPSHANTVELVINDVNQVLERALRASSGLTQRLQSIERKVLSDIRRDLSTLSVAIEGVSGQVYFAGTPVIDREGAAIAREHLKAEAERSELLQRLPQAWQVGVDPLEKTEKDLLHTSLTVASRVARTPVWARVGAISPRTFLEIVDLAETDTKRKLLLDQHSEFREQIKGEIHSCVPMSPATALLLQGVEKDDPRTYREALKGVDVEREKARKAQELGALRDHLRSVHRVLADRLDEDSERILAIIDELPYLESARDHRDETLRQSAGIQCIEDIHSSLAEVHNAIRKAEARIAEARCWLGALERLEADRSLSSSLSALVSAIASVPKTRTAKSYGRRIKGVREATKRASPAIPCWLMSIDRIPEVLNDFRDTEKFDVVVVDEASQAWFSSLFLYALADQVIIVGDDMQTSPTAGGVLGEDDLKAIVSQHIPRHRLATQVGDDLSIYDVATAMTAPVTLVDHFRCQPEIIGISNEMSYKPKGKTLLPIRTRTAKSLEPVVRVRVDGTRSTGTAANAEEVDLLVNQVFKCMSDSQYDGLSFGVVVVGTNPNAHIKKLREQLLLNVGPREMASRQLKIGSASEFQGSERDVMFLSLVDAPPEGGRIRTRPLEYSGRNRKFVQQLNVAVSRAREQLWIFHSFGPGDLGENDARQKILEDHVSVSPDLESELMKCNGFESDVVMALHASFPEAEIRTQVEALGYFIDIVITHENGNRLAVECDGDRWHLDDSSMRSDLYRQRALERVGWRFYRFLSSEWYGDEESHLSTIRVLLEGGEPSRRPSEVRVTSNVSARTRKDSDSLAPLESDTFSSMELLESSVLFETEDSLIESDYFEAGIRVEQGILEEVLVEVEPPDDSQTEFVGEIEELESQSRLFRLTPIEPPAGFSDASWDLESIKSETVDLPSPLEIEIEKPVARQTSSPKASPKSSSRESVREQNRKLAAALRKIGKDPRGRDWILAKKLLKEGHSIDDAARLAGDN